AVGITAHATDINGGTITYSLTDDAGGRFAINASTGLVTVANGTLLDAEAAGSHQITVQASDGTLTSSQTFTIAVSDVNEFSVSTPVDTDAGSNNVSENVAAGTVVGVTAFASDADATTNTVSYSLSSNPGGLFQIDATTGVVTTAAAINRETVGASVDIEVTAS